MNLARTIRFDASDLNIFLSLPKRESGQSPAVSPFSICAEDQITGKVRQAFANGFLGVESFGYSTFVAVASASPEARAALRDQLIRRFVEDMGAPSEEAAGHAADEEIGFMIDLCSGINRGHFWWSAGMGRRWHPRIVPAYAEASIPVPSNRSGPLLKTIRTQRKVRIYHDGRGFLVYFRLAFDGP